MRHDLAIIPSYKINSDKWNRCVDSSNGLVYANSWYLDRLADNWSGIISGDYEQVMPVAWRKKYGIRYSYHVPFIQQLGIYGDGEPSNEQSFVDALRSYCRYGDYPFNYRNVVGEKAQHHNFVLYLDRPYESIAGKFSADTLQNLRRAASLNLYYQQGDIDQAVSAFQKLYAGINVTPEQYARFRQLCVYLAENDKIIVRRVVAPDGSLLATALLIRHQDRVYNVMNSTVPEGKKKEANYYLLSQVWKEFEMSGITFDFEGSDLPGVREFYRKFGGINEPYYNLHFNHLPWPMKLFKK